MVIQRAPHTAFDANNYLIKLKGKDYLPVCFRLVWFRDQYPHGIIQTEMIHLDLDKGIAIFKATVSDGQGGMGVGHGSESSKDFGDFLEKAETKSIGRALATLGFGTQFAPELEEGDRIVDSPVTRHNANLNGNVSQSNSSQKSLRIEAGKESATSAGQVNDKSGQHFDKARLQALYHAGKNAGLLNGEGWTALFEWASSTLKREVNRPSELTIEEIVQLETIVKPEAAQHA